MILDGIGHLAVRDYRGVLAAVQIDCRNPARWQSTHRSDVAHVGTLGIRTHQGEAIGVASLVSPAGNPFALSK